MKLVKRTPATDSNLVSCNVPENDYAQWNSSTTYSIGNKVIVLTTHKIYEALTNNTNKYPPDNSEGTTPDWLDLGATNRWKMFDESYQSQTVNSTSIEISINPGRINTVALLNLDAANVQIVYNLDGSSVYTKDINLIATNVNDWHEYFFMPIERDNEVVLTDLPAIGDGNLNITITGAGTVKCGLCIIGYYIVIGDSLWGASVGIIDYSKKEVDTFGNYTIITRGFSNKLNDSIFLPNGRVGYIRRLLSEYRTTPALWIPTEKINGISAYGFFRDFQIVLEDYSGAKCSIEIEGLI